MDFDSLLIPALIFVAELCVVTLATIRTIFVARGKRVLAPVLGFFEVSIWLFAIGLIMRNLSHIGCYLAFAGGFTLGNFLGIFIESKLALGSLLVRIITSRDPGGLIESLQAARLGVTTLNGQGVAGPVRVILTVIQRRERAQVIGLIEAFDPEAFYCVDDLIAVEGASATRGRGRIATWPTFSSPAPPATPASQGKRTFAR